jgi:hypothetical protein
MACNTLPYKIAALREAHHLGDVLHRPAAERPYRSHQLRLLPRKLGPVVSLAARLPPLGDLVIVVVGLGAEKEMLRVGTGAHVAAVQHAEPIRDRPDVQHMRDTMAEQHARDGGSSAIAG